MGQSEGRQAADPEALMLPGQHVVGQVDFLVYHGELDLRVLTAHHLGGSERDRKNTAGVKNYALSLSRMCDDLPV